LGCSGCVYLIQASKATKTTSGPVGLCLSHSGVGGSPKTLLGQWGCAYLIPALTANKTTSGPVGLCLSHSGIEKLPRPLRGQSGRILLIPASKVTQNTFEPVGLTVYHSGVKGHHPDHFWAGRAKNKKAKKLWCLLNAQRFITLTVQTCDVKPLKVYT
jgi:hypothetical protein